MMAARVVRTNFTSYNDNGVVRNGVIEFFVLTNNPIENPLDAVGAPPDMVGVPKQFDPHPFSLGLFSPALARNREVVAMDSTGLNWKVTVTYTNEAYFGYWDQTYRSESFVPRMLKFPFLNQRPVITLKVLPTTPGGRATFDIRFDWQKQDGERELFWENYQTKVILGAQTNNGVYGPQQEQLIRAQIGKFHYLAPTPYAYDFPAADLLAPDDQIWPTHYNELWQFNGCDVEQVKTTTWHLTYSWTRDPGNFRLAPATWTPTPIAGTTNTVVYPLARPPFFQYKVVQKNPLINSDGTVTQYTPKIIVIPIYADTDITGYQGAHNLPGHPV